MPRELAIEGLDFAKLTRPGDRIAWGQGAGEPSSVVIKLLEQRHRIGNAEIFLGGVRSARTLQAEHADVLCFTSFGAMGNLQALAKADALELIPTHLSRIHDYFEQGLLRADVVLVQLSGSNAEGVYSYGLGNDFQVAAMTHARTVIAEVNDQLPWTFCEGGVDLNRIDYIVRTSVRAAIAKPQAARAGRASDCKPSRQLHRGRHHDSDWHRRDPGRGDGRSQRSPRPRFPFGADQRSRRRADAARGDHEHAQTDRHRPHDYWRAARH